MCWCDLENEVNVPKMKSTISPLPKMYLWKYVRNPPTGSEVEKAEIHSLYWIVTVKIRSRPPISNQLCIVSRSCNI